MALPFFEIGMKTEVYTTQWIILKYLEVGPNLIEKMLENKKIIENSEGIEEVFETVNCHCIGSEGFLLQKRNIKWL